MSTDIERQVLNLNNVLVHCLEFQNVLTPVEKDSSIYKHKLKQKLKAVEVECEKILESWVDQKPNDSEEEKRLKEVVTFNLRNFYQLFEMIMQLNSEDINEVQLHIFDKYFSKEEYKDKKKFVDFVPELNKK